MQMTANVNEHGTYTHVELIGVCKHWVRTFDKYRFSCT